MSLRWRIVVGLALIAALVTAAGSAAAYVSTSRQLHASVDQSLATRAGDADRAGSPRGRSVGAPEVGYEGTGEREGRPAHPHPEREGPCAVAARPPVDAAQLVDADGIVTPCRDGLPILPTGPTDQGLADGDGPSALRTVSVDGVRYRLLTVAQSQGGALQVARDLTEVDNVLGGLWRRLAALGLAGVVAASVLGWLVARRVVRPVDRLRDAAERIARTQDLATPLTAGGSGEVGSLARSLTTMVGALATSRDQQQRLVTDASHELRTPLTSLRTNIELLGRAEDLPAGQRREVLADLQFEVEELTHLVTELVELATDRHGEDEPSEAVLLTELARSVATRSERRTGRAVTIRQARVEPSDGVAGGIPGGIGEPPAGSVADRLDGPDGAGVAPWGAPIGRSRRWLRDDPRCSSGPSPTWSTTPSSTARPLTAPSRWRWTEAAWRCVTGVRASPPSTGPWCSSASTGPRRPAPNRARAWGCRSSARSSSTTVAGCGPSSGPAVGRPSASSFRP